MQMRNEDAREAEARRPKQTRPTVAELEAMLRDGPYTVESRPDGSIVAVPGRRNAVFHLQRDKDESGVSGTGRVAQGFVFADGTVALRWLTEHRSTAVYASLGDVEKIHGHNGATRIVWEAV